MIFWILQTSEPVHLDSLQMRPMRAMNLADFLLSKNHKVVLWTSDFDHYSKIKRYGSTKEIELSSNFEIIFIKSPGYSKNISLSRFIDHFIMAFNLSKILKRKDPPDLAILGMPPIETSWVMAKWLYRRRIPFYIDIKDAWPEIFIQRVSAYSKTFLIFFILPLRFIRNKTLKMATGISAPTKEFLEWTIRQANRTRNQFDRVTPLTTPLLDLNSQQRKTARETLDKLGISNNNKFRLCFIGSLTTAYDFRPLVKAIERTEVELIIAGSGPISSSLEILCSNNPKIKLIGWVDNGLVREILERSTAFVIPLRNSFDFKMSIPNKFYDAISGGLPVITSLNGSIRDLIIHNNIGFIYDEKNPNSLKYYLEKIRNNPEMVRSMSLNAKHLYDNFFSFEIVYESFFKNLTGMHSKKIN